jgi:hypothetical protein
MRCLRPAALAGHRYRIARARILRGEIASLEAERFGDAKPAAIEQPQHRRVARADPRLALVAGRGVRIGHAFGGVRRQRPRQRLAELRRPHRRKRSDLALAVAFQITAECPQPGQGPHQRAAADPVRPPRRQERAHVRRRERREFLQRRRAAEVLGQKA